MGRNMISLWCVMLLMATSPLMAQNIPEEVASAFRKANPDALSRCTGSQVELLVESYTTQTGREAMTREMARFFADHPVKDFTLKHRGKREESGFLVGILTTSKGTFRVNCFFKKENNQYVIHQIRIEKTND